MKLVPVAKTSDAIKVVDLYETQPLIGIYLGKSNPKYSWIYELRIDDEGTVKKIYGNKSLDSQMGDHLIGKVLHITCTKIEGGYARPFGVAQVCEVVDDGDPEMPDSNDPNVLPASDYSIKV